VEWGTVVYGLPEAGVVLISAGAIMKVAGTIFISAG
jgi:hypothetical protein